MCGPLRLISGLVVGCAAVAAGCATTNDPKLSAQVILPDRSPVKTADDRRLASNGSQSIQPGTKRMTSDDRDNEPVSPGSSEPAVVVIAGATLTEETILKVVLERNPTLE